VGFEDAMDTVARDMRDAIPNDLGLTLGSISTVQRTDMLHCPARWNTINQTISVVRPRHLSEKELARSLRTCRASGAGILKEERAWN
jgi:hypothetical protein